MHAIYLSGPSLEPLSLSEAKLWLKVDHDDEDILIRTLITAARVSVETYINQALIAQKWRMQIRKKHLERGAHGYYVTAPNRPLLSLDQIMLIDADGAEESLTKDAARFDRYDDCETIYIAHAIGPDEVLQIDYTIGFGSIPEDVPATCLQVIRSLIGEWYQERGFNQAARQMTILPDAIAQQLSPLKKMRL